MLWQMFLKMGCKMARDSFAHVFTLKKTHDSWHLHLCQPACLRVIIISWNSDDKSMVALIHHRFQASDSGAVRTACSGFSLPYSSIHFSQLLCQEKLLPVRGLLSSAPNVSAVTSGSKLDIPSCTGCWAGLGHKKKITNDHPVWCKDAVFISLHIKCGCRNNCALLLIYAGLSIPGLH